MAMKAMKATKAAVPTKTMKAMKRAKQTMKATNAAAPTKTMKAMKPAKQVMKATNAAAHTKTMKAMQRAKQAPKTMWNHVLTRNIADLFVARRLGKRPCRAGGASACRLADALTVERGKASAQSQERAASRVTACVVSTLADDYAQAPLNFMHWLYSHAYPVVVGLWDLLGADFEWRDLNVLFEVSERSETVFLSECHAA